ncbi:tyrosine-type recombinase/integrase [Burkholderia sp. B21-005]|uniref:tyrosine-type recombinase/integrase n=1 Tax=Burkholderia sp. B21-005 TaxID=2890406 RepID=UPI001E4EF743|nr:tyrosine-type recombinase/integrase [Burkholderia sp. B21-005]UEP43188.1 tyrosine-type recombinase/integrase [Burkholderia sp. B21-005]
MAARPRIRRRANWPSGLHEPRQGYYTWRDPRNGKTIVLGRMPLAQAIYEVQEANAKIAAGIASGKLADRIDNAHETIADLLLKMPTDGVKASTEHSRRYRDKAIREGLGDIECAKLTTKDVAAFLEKIESRGANKWALMIRSRLSTVCRKGIALGWMEKNPVEVTEKPKFKVKRRRLTLDEFNAILRVADKAAAWLPNAMLLALVSGQDRSTVGRWPRNSVHNGYAIVQRSKTETKIAIPLELRMNAIGLSLGEVIARCKGTHVVSKYLIHHVRAQARTRIGDPVSIAGISNYFAEARKLAGIVGDDAPTFHEIRSLSKRLYVEQGGVDTKALLGHKDDKTAALYGDSRGLEPVKVKITAA